MIDPDAPSRANPIYAQWLHWAVVNVPAANVVATATNAQLQKGANVVAEYAGPTPPPGSGLHRYVILVYRQSAAVTAPSTTIASGSSTGRMGFNVVDYMDGLDAHAELVSGTFFLAQTPN
jgi:phosphatidylethanolamine-binding protein (PEBP) family uncharacterized protein